MLTHISNAKQPSDEIVINPTEIEDGKVHLREDIQYSGQLSEDTRKLLVTTTQSCREAREDVRRKCGKEDQSSSPLHASQLSHIHELFSEDSLVEMGKPCHVLNAARCLYTLHLVFVQLQIVWTSKNLSQTPESRKYIPRPM